MRNLKTYKQLTDFQYLAMLVLCEVLSFADHDFVEDAQKQFFAFNSSKSGELNFNEFQ